MQTKKIVKIMEESTPCIHCMEETQHPFLNSPCGGKGRYYIPTTQLTKQELQELETQKIIYLWDREFLEDADMFYTQAGYRAGTNIIAELEKRGYTVEIITLQEQQAQEEAYEKAQQAQEEKLHIDTQNAKKNWQKTREASIQQHYVHSSYLEQEICLNYITKIGSAIEGQKELLYGHETLQHAAFNNEPVVLENMGNCWIAWGARSTIEKLEGIRKELLEKENIYCSSDIDHMQKTFSEITAAGKKTNFISEIKNVYR